MSLSESKAVSLLLMLARAVSMYLTLSVVSVAALLCTIIAVNRRQRFRIIFLCLTETLMMLFEPIHYITARCV